ncbi:unnamed protein product [Linum trigynum]|uniref:Glycosyltransferase n=1 Tax=Linum trigynum TaxID=586398 RepID=A0AAV2G5G0_9ROSI
MAAATEISIEPVHILVFPYPAQGHLIPLLDFTHHLAARSAGRLKITILATPKNLPLLQPLLSRHPSTIQALTLPFPPHPSIPPGVENAKDFPPNPSHKPGGVHLLMIAALGGLRSPLLRWFQSTPSPPSAIISDMFLGWTHRLASDLGIPRVVFSPSAAVTLSVVNYLWRYMPVLPEDPDSPFLFPQLPNSPAWPTSQLSSIYRSYVAGDPVSEFIKDGFLANMESWGAVFNSFHALESKYLDYLKKELGHDRVWAVGPLLPPAAASGGDGNGKDRGGASSVSVSDLEAWLDSCPDDRVVYVCFGSEAVLTADQTAALASGLEKSGVRFVWSVKGGGAGHVAREFEDRVAGRGVVIRGWAPQVTILSHRAVGAFLTHCGWNSVLEGIVAGVAMLTWPMGADQFIDATLLEEELKVGVRVCQGKNSVPDSAELARRLAEMMAEEEGREERKRAKELSRAAVEAVRDGGSSTGDLDSLVDHLVKLATPSGGQS